MPNRDETESRRTLAKRAKRTAGDRSSELARVLMKLAASSLSKLELDEDLQHAVDRARKITAQNARRRAERQLAGDLRGHDLIDLARKLANVNATGSSEPDLMHAAERWRTRLIEEGSTAAAEFPGGNVEPLPQLIMNARREKTTGKPPGAARSLFRHIAATLKAQRVAETTEADDDAGTTDDDSDDADGDDGDDA